MRRLSLLTILLSMIFFMLSCSNDKEFLDNSPNNDVPDIVPTTRVVSSEQAEKFGNLAMAAILEKESDATRSNETRSSSEVIPILDNDGLPVLYAINFGDDQGFMLLSADKESPNSMLAFNDIGHFDLSSAMDISSPMNFWLEAQKEMISTNIAQGINKNQESYEMWESFDNTDATIEIELVNFSDVKDLVPETRGRHKGSNGLSYVSVGYATRSCLWGQGRGYNADAPHPNVDLAGCPAVAIGLLCRHHRFPSKYTYSSMPSQLNTSASNAISKMFRDIGNNIPNYFWSSTGSGARTAADILTGVKRIGYTTAKLGSYDFMTAYNNIKARRPVLLIAYSNNGGHIWIADGYLEQVWKVTRKFLGIKIKSWYEYQDNLYMNWGWNGSNNAWVDQASWPDFNKNRQMLYNLIPQ